MEGLLSNNLFSKASIFGSKDLTLTSQDEVSAVYQDTIAEKVPIYLENAMCFDTFSTLTNPSSLPATNVTGIVFTPDGKYVIECSSGQSIRVYKRTKDAFNLYNSYTPAGQPYSVGISPGGDYVVVGINVSPWVEIYSLTNGSLTQLPNPSVLPTGSVYGISFSPDGNYLALSHATSPYVTIYSRFENTFTKLANPSTLPPYTGWEVSFSKDSDYLCVGHGSSPFITIYSHAGNVFSKIADPSSLPTTLGEVPGVAFSPIGNYLVVANSYGSPYICAYSYSNGIFTKISISTQPTGVVGTITHVRVKYSPDGQYVAVTGLNSGSVYIYKQSGSSFVYKTTKGSYPVAAAFTADGMYLALGLYNSPYIAFLKAATVISGLYLATASTTIGDLASKVGAGYTKDAGIYNDVKKVVRLWR